MAELRAVVPLRSAAFRFGLLLALLFAIGCALLLGSVKQQIGSYAEEATTGTLRIEATVLRDEFEHQGRPGLIDAIERHSRAGNEAQFRYLLTDPNGKRIFGDLPLVSGHSDWMAVPVTEIQNGKPARETFSALQIHLSDGSSLTVATDTFDIESLRRRLELFTVLSGVCITLFALVGGYIIGGLFLRRLGRVNRVVDRIVDGERSERLPTIGFGPEFDDLTHNLNRMLDRNAAAMEALRQVSTDIAHDLRTPLSRLRQHLEVMRESPVSDPGAIDAALSQTDRLLGIIQALLRIGTLEGGVGRLRFKTIDLSELTDRIAEAYRPVAEDAGQVLIADRAEDIFVDGDAELLAQMLTNLIENAIVHTPPDTSITLRLAVEDGQAVVEVSDTGPGIPRHERTRVFARFYRLDGSRQSDGAGLGLALVAAIANLHGASVGIVDSAVGLRIMVRIPLR